MPERVRSYVFDGGERTVPLSIRMRTREKIQVPGLRQTIFKKSEFEIARRQRTPYRGTLAKAGVVRGQKENKIPKTGTSRQNRAPEPPRRGPKIHCKS